MICKSIRNCPFAKELDTNVRCSLSLNHYGTTWATGQAVKPDGDPRFNMDEIDKTWVKDGQPIGRRGDEGHPHTGK